MNNPASMRGSDDEVLQRGGKRIPLPLDEARSKLYVLPNGQLYTRSDCFREAGIIAASDIRDPTRKGRSTMTKRFSASVFLCTDHCPLYRADGNHAPIMAKPEPKDVQDFSAEWIIDRRRVVVQKQGILRSRPRIENWCCPLEFEFDEDIIDKNLILAVIQQSGKFPGIMDYRVGKKGPFGRYSAEFMNSTDFDAQQQKKKGKKS